MPFHFQCVKSMLPNMLLVAFLAMPILSADARTKLTKAQVEQLFIGKPWRGPKGGTFMFHSDGRYQFKRGSKKTKLIPYKIKLDGTLWSSYTSYRFYRTKNGGYEYYHTRSRRFWRARP